MEPISLLSLVVAIAAAFVAIEQLRAGRRDAHAARMADLAWQIYEMYEDESIRKGRKAIEVVANREPVPSSGKEFGSYYVVKRETEHYRFLAEEIGENPSNAIRRILRFYHQIGILLDKRLIDADFVFALIGPGLFTSEKGIAVSSEWYQNFWAGEAGHEQANERPIYAKALQLCSQYKVWAEKQNRPM